MSAGHVRAGKLLNLIFKTFVLVIMVWRGLSTDPTQRSNIAVTTGECLGIQRNPKHYRSRDLELLVWVNAQPIPDTQQLQDRLILYCE